jgi:histidine triad (HIT) family protein
MIIGLIFSRFSNILPVNRVKDTAHCLAFWHPSPSWEKHIVIVPKKAIKSLSDLKTGDEFYLKEVMLTAHTIVTELNWEDLPSGYSLTLNGGSRQEINQIHFHLHSGPPVTP